MFTRDNVVGFLTGIAAAAVGFYFYKQNEGKVDAFLAGKGIVLPGAGEGAGADEGALPLEDLVQKKERLEDLIAEREATN